MQEWEDIERSQLHRLIRRLEESVWLPRSGKVSYICRFDVPTDQLIELHPGVCSGLKHQYKYIVTLSIRANLANSVILSVLIVLVVFNKYRIYTQKWMFVCMHASSH